MFISDYFPVLLIVFAVPIVIGLAVTASAVRLALAVVAGKVEPSVWNSVLVFSAFLSFFCFFLLGFTSGEFGRLIVFGSWPFFLLASILRAFEMGFIVLLVTGTGIAAGSIYVALKLHGKHWLLLIALGALLAALGPPLMESRVINAEAEKQAREMDIEIEHIKSLFYSLQWRQSSYRPHHGIAHDAENRLHYWSYTERAWILDPVLSTGQPVPETSDNDQRG